MIGIDRRTLIGAAASTAFAPSLVLAGGGTPVVTHTVEIRKFKFVPAQLTVRVGDSIVWINRDIAPHTATATDGSWDTGTIRKDESITTTVSSAITGSYYCRFHRSMRGELKLPVDGRS